MPRPSTFAALLLAVSLGACATLKGGYTPPRMHPEELARGRPVCSAADCHQGSRSPIAYDRFDHTLAFADRDHGTDARQAERLCEMCHEQSFCDDCHAQRTELKPSAKNPVDSYRRMPHRGDYLSRHRIDGRLDPTSCLTCHGNRRSSQACVACHGK